jgi:chromosome segregation ATPase
MNSESNPKDDLLLNIWTSIKGMQQSLSAKIDGVEERLGGRIDGVEEKLDKRIDETNRRIDETNRRFDETNVQVKQTRNEMIGHMRQQELRLATQITSMTDAVHQNIDGIKHYNRRLTTVERKVARLTSEG